MSTFLKNALALHQHGYNVLPVKPSLKRVVIEGWSRLETTAEDIRGWAANGYKNGNIGITTRDTPAVDIDVLDAEVAQEMEDWIARQFGDAPVRVGRAPKRLMLFRTNEPFRKLQATFTDGKTDHKLEILGSGQQFVAFGVHPDTKRPYEWTSMDNPLDTPAASLPLLTAEDAKSIIEKFAQVCEARGWEELSRSGGGAGASFDLEDFKPVLRLAGETIRDTLDTIPNPGRDFDLWLEIGMALHHQFEGGGEGLQHWHQWSEASPAYEPSEVNRRWDSFGMGPATVTFASLLLRAKNLREEASSRAFETALTRAGNCRDKRKLQGEVIKELAKLATNDIQLDQAVRKVQTRLGELEDGAKPRVESVRKMFAAAMPKAKKAAEAPRWVENWCYVQSDGTFYNVVTGRKLAAAVFDRTYGRELITQENRDAGEAFAGKASDVALNLYQVPVVYDYLYVPGADDFFELNGDPMVNTYNNHKIVSGRAPRSAEDRRAIALLERHLEVLIADGRERRLFLDFLAYNVQFPSERVRWAPVLQGVEGGGKSYFNELMAAVMGQHNIGVATAGDLHEQYTHWAEGSKLVFFEEIRVAGLEKYDVANKLKAYITNPTVTIRRMQRNSYLIPNMTNYIAFTNYIDAIPFDANDRRYFVLRTTFLTKSHIEAWVAKNPNYFGELFDSLATHAPVLRWYLETHELSDEFKPRGQAPRTGAWRLMYDASSGKDDETDELSGLLAESPDPYLSDALLSSRRLCDKGVEFAGLAPRALGHALTAQGFVVLGKFRLDGRDGPKETLYTRRSELFAGGVTVERVREVAAGLEAAPEHLPMPDRVRWLIDQGDGLD